MSAPRTPKDFYAATETAVPALDKRLNVFLQEYRRQRAAVGRPVAVLDVGCGRRPVLPRYIAAGDTWTGCDIAPAERDDVEFLALDLNEQSLGDALEGRRFDVVFCGEVIEHVFSPDALLDDLGSILADDGVLVLSTPNLAYWVNRLLLLFGISPLFLENSATVKLGRRFKALGEGNPTQGHLRVFTYRAMSELLRLRGFALVRTQGVPVWPFLVDTLVCRLSPAISPDVVYVARKRRPDDDGGHVADASQPRRQP